MAIVLFAGSFESFAAGITFSDAEMNTTMDLLAEVVSKNLGAYSVTATADQVQTALIMVAKNNEYLAGEYVRMQYKKDANGEYVYNDAGEVETEAVTVTGAERLTETPVAEIIEMFIDNYNYNNGWIPNGVNKGTAQIGEIPTVPFVEYDATKSTTYGGIVMRTDYTYGKLIMEYLRKKQAPAGLLLDEEILSIISKHVKSDTPSVAMSTIGAEIQEKANEKNDGDEAFNDEEYLDTFMGPHTVTYADYMMTHTVPSSTLFIGTYLIDAMTINDVFYRYAKDSMGLHNQQIMYYKSELDSGHWKDIISAAGLSDLLPSAESVQDADLAKYKITCVIGSDGIPRYPDDDTEADIFAMMNPYDMESIPELIPLKTLYNAGAVSQDTSDVSSRYAADVLYRFFNYDGVGDNKAMLIVRNKGYRDYLYDHPGKSNALLGENPIPMNTKVNITDAEIKYVTDLGNKNINFDANMPQCEDRYPGHQGAFFDQLLAWAEYYATDHNGRSGFVKRKDGYGIPRPTILPSENFGTSAWEEADTKPDWQNPQSFMYILNGSTGSNDQNEWINEWLTGTYISYYKDGKWTDRTELVAKNWRETNIMDVTTAVSSTEYANGSYTNNNNVAIEWGSKWMQFCNMIYRYMDWMRNMYDIRDEETYECDEILEELYVLYKAEYQAGNLVEADTLMRLMSRVDAKRRAKIYYNLVFNEEHNVVVGPTLMYLVGLLQNGEGHLGQNYKYMSGLEDPNFSAQESVLSAAEDAVTNCQEKYMEYNGMAYGPGTTVIKNKEYELSQKAIFATNNTERHAALHDLAVVYNIEEGAIVNKKDELRVIDEIIVLAGDQYAARLHDVANEDYRIAAADPQNTKGTLNAYLELQKADADGAVAQLQNLIKAYALRLNTSQGTMFINRRLDWAEAMADGIRMDDPYGKYANDSLKEHIDWLKQILKQVKNGTLSGNDPIEEPDLIADYQAQMLTALDNNNLDEANRLQGEINKANAQGGSGDDGSGSGDGNGGTDGDLNGTNAELQELIDDIRREIYSDPTDPDRVPVLLEALGALGDPNIGDMEDYLDRYDAGRDAMNALDGAIDAAKNSELNPSDDGSDDDANKKKDKNGPDVSDDALKRAIEGALGKKFEELGDDDKAAIVAACTRFGRDRNVDDVTSFGQRIATMALGENNPFFYHQFKADPTTEYINLAAVDRPRMQTGLRYVKLGRKATMSQTGQQSTTYRTFSIGSKDLQVRIQSKDQNGKETSRIQKSELSKNVVQQTDEYIRGSLTRNYAYAAKADTEQHLNITCEYVPASEYAVFLTIKVNNKAIVIYNAIDDLVTALEEEQAAAEEEELEEEPVDNGDEDAIPEEESEETPEPDDTEGDEETE